MIPEIARLLKEKGYVFRWYLVGDGRLRFELENAIRSYGLENQVVLLGGKQNPYPYIKNCDLYVQPSFSEAYCLTLAEARILCRPIVTTNATGNGEQIRDGENGLIVESMTAEALAEGIKTLLDHPEMMEKFKNTLKTESYDYSKQLQKLYDFIEN
jgi:glycosyltransferase involved in cell wall biosynthesis